jgi:hypothetical protein
MDVSGWTVDQRMRLPDWCFGNRQLIGLYDKNVGVGTNEWAISEIGLPDPACVWEFGFIGMMVAGSSGQFKVGLLDALPGSEAEFALATEIIPYFGIPMAGHNVVGLYSEQYQYAVFRMRKGMVTGGKKLVIEHRCIAGTSRVLVWVLVSGLPTNMAGWLAHEKV